MSPKDLFLAAIEKPAAEREAYLAELPLEARQRVRELLSAHAAEAGALGSLPSDSPTATIPIDTPAPVDPQAAATLEMGRATQVTTSAAGQHLGSYDLLEVLGQGGFGTVFRAFDQKLHRVVAVKVLAPELAAQGPARQRFLREARAAAAVRHENVIVSHAVDEEPRPHLVMEYISGKTLQQKIDQDGALATLEILRIGGQIAAGLAAAHQQGLIHRDIKPANILLENGVERVKISDFGLARAVDDASISQSGIIAGTPMYMSPEQAEGKLLDPRTDLFSLGSTLYTLCAGHAPFRATSTLAVLKRVTEDEPRPIRESNPAIPDWLSAVVARLMAKNPDQRFQSAKEVAELLQQHLAHEQQPGQARRPAALPPTPTAKTRRSERLLFLGRGLLALFALAALLWIMEARGITSFSRFLWFFHHEITLLLPDRETIVEIFETTDTEARPDAFSIKLGWPGRPGPGPQ